MKMPVLLAALLAICATGARAEIYRCADPKGKLLPTFLRLEGGRFALTRAPTEQGWADLCSRPGGTCGTDKHGRFHARIFGVDGGEDDEFDPAKLRLVFTGISLSGSDSHKFSCAPLAPEAAAKLPSSWRPTPAWF